MTLVLFFFVSLAHIDNGDGLCKIFNSSKHNQRFCFEVFNKKLLIDTEPSFSSWLTIKQNQKLFDEFQKIAIFIWRYRCFWKKCVNSVICWIKTWKELLLLINHDKNFCYCFLTNSADWAKILPRAKTTTKNFYQKLLGNYVHLRFTRALLIYRISIAWFLIYIGLRHKAVRTTAYLSSDFSRQWWSSSVSSLFLELQNLCRIQTGLYLLQLVFCCKSYIDTFWIFSDILIQGIYVYQIIQIWFLF